MMIFQGKMRESLTLISIFCCGFLKGVAAREAFRKAYRDGMNYESSTLDFAPTVSNQAEVSIDGMQGLERSLYVFEFPTMSPKVSGRQVHPTSEQEESGADTYSGIFEFPFEEFAMEEISTGGDSAYIGRASSQEPPQSANAAFFAFDAPVNTFEDFAMQEISTGGDSAYTGRASSQEPPQSANTAFFEFDTPVNTFEDFAMQEISAGGQESSQEPPQPASAVFYFPFDSSVNTETMEEASNFADKSALLPTPIPEPVMFQFPTIAPLSEDVSVPTSIPEPALFQFPTTAPLSEKGSVPTPIPEPVLFQFPVMAPLSSEEVSLPTPIPEPVLFQFPVMAPQSEEVSASTKSDKYSYAPTESPFTEPINSPPSEELSHTDDTPTVEAARMEYMNAHVSIAPSSSAPTEFSTYMATLVSDYPTSSQEPSVNPTMSEDEVRIGSFADYTTKPAESVTLSPEIQFSASSWGASLPSLAPATTIKTKPPVQLLTEDDKASIQSSATLIQASPYFSFSMISPTEPPTGAPTEASSAEPFDLLQEWMMGFAKLADATASPTPPGTEEATSERTASIPIESYYPLTPSEQESAKGTRIKAASETTASIPIESYYPLDPSEQESAKDTRIESTSEGAASIPIESYYPLTPSEQESAKEGASVESTSETTASIPIESYYPLTPDEQESAKGARISTGISDAPSPQPTFAPTTAKPSLDPTSNAPSTMPSKQPTITPTGSLEPSPLPSKAPSLEPSIMPSLPTLAYLESVLLPPPEDSDAPPNQYP